MAPVCGLMGVAVGIIERTIASLKSEGKQRRRLARNWEGKGVRHGGARRFPISVKEGEGSMLCAHETLYCATLGQSVRGLARDVDVRSRPKTQFAVPS